MPSKTHNTGQHIGDSTLGTAEGNQVNPMPSKTHNTGQHIGDSTLGTAGGNQVNPMRSKTHNSVVCAGCYSHMGGGRAVLTDDGNRFHLTCFCCTSCGASLVGSPKVCRLQGRLMCAACSARFAPTCSSCRRSIHSQDFLYLAPNYYHADHLVCQGCGDSAMASRGLFTFGGGAPLCAYCALVSRGLVCCSCGHLITGRFLRHGRRRWHVQCFRCSSCGQQCQLGAQRMSIVSGQLACKLCCSVAAVTSRLTLAVAMPAVAALIENDPSDFAVPSRVPWGRPGYEAPPAGDGQEKSLQPYLMLLQLQQQRQQNLEQQQQQPMEDQQHKYEQHQQNQLAQEQQSAQQLQMLQKQQQQQQQHLKQQKHRRQFQQHQLRQQKQQQQKLELLSDAI